MDDRGKGMVSIREVAKRAGVSLGTVSNVLNKPEIVAEETRVKVLGAIEELGFVRNGSARQLRAGRSLYLGLVVLDVANPFFTDIARGVEDVASEAGYAVILCNSDGSITKEEHYLKILEEQRAQGLLITPVSDNTPYLERLHERGTSITLIDRPSQSPEHCSVTVDDVRGGEMAIEHLLEQGHQHIAFINGPLSTRQCVDRLEGVQRALQGAALDPAHSLLTINVPALNSREGEKSVEALLWLDEATRPTAIFCANDLLALGVMRGLHSRGYAIPRDFALVGYDDVEFASVLAVPLTSVRQPKYKLGQVATQLLLEEIADPETHQHRQIVYQPELIIRESSRWRRHP